MAKAALQAKKGAGKEIQKSKDTKIKESSDYGFTPEERKKGFKLEYTSDGTAKVHYTNDALKNMDI